MSDATDSMQTADVPRGLRVNVVGGAVVMFIAGLIWFGAIGLDVGQLTRLGSGAVPKALALLLLAAGGWVMATGLMRCEGEADRLNLALRPGAIVVAAMLVFAFFIRGGDFGPVSTPQLGLTVVGPLTVVVAGCAARDMRLGELLVTAFGLTATLLLVFADLLGVAVPVFPKFLENGIEGAVGSETALRMAYGAYGTLAAILYGPVFGWGRKGSD